MNYLENGVYMPEDLGSWGLDDLVPSYYDSSSPEGVLSPSAASKNIVSERNRRRKLNDRLFALRAVVPNISKMDKASIIKDAIDHIQKLREQERRIETEIYELESGKSKKKIARYEFEQEVPLLHTPKRNKTDQFSYYDSSATRYSPIEVLDLSVTYMGERTIVVSLTCCKRADSMVKLCKVFESLKLKIITANITAVSGRLLKTVFIEAGQEERDLLKIKIETALAGLNDPQSPVSI
ncbi:transcription factor bHLH35-like [Cucurbita pepo subsp. pepo]|uniref:transcription factor bHLH35-like n=1 Tax=Cucurbita pepo subsp. pepo TaxID=3664 RepID=UPI000C9D9F8D|nr:transcription factor bHLH35-like [Cucurbita pepo subsp. pepo]